MNKKFSISEFRKSLSKSDFLMQCKIPLGYSQGIPLLREVGGQVCLVIPFLKYKVTGKVDETLSYPIRYTISADATTGEIIGFENLQFNYLFQGIDFSAPVGKFRHETLKKYDKEACGKLFGELYHTYDRIIDAIRSGESHALEDENVRRLLAILLAPELRETYKLLDQAFFDRYVACSSVSDDGFVHSVRKEVSTCISDDDLQKL